jgi:SAM-dependent methyltransferase
MTKLNLGCGQNKKPGYVNVDKYESFSPEIVWDLETVPWPFEDSSAEEIVMHHSLEHMGATTEGFLAIMKELYRVCAPGAKVFIAVPHPRSDSYAGDPTHVRPITTSVMSLFSKRVNRECAEKGWPNTPLATYLDIDFEMSDVIYAFRPMWDKQVREGKMSREELEMAVDSYYNVVDGMELTLTAIK